MRQSATFRETPVTLTLVLRAIRALKDDGPMYQMVNISTFETSLVSLDEAVTVMELDPDEIEWALEEFGRCDGELYTLLPEGVVYTPYTQED